MYTVKIDSREQKIWPFILDDRVNGHEICTLKTGDYTLKGYEDIFVIERKGAVAEFVANLTAERFERELQRLEEFKYPFLVLEFDMIDLLTFPANSGIPRHRWPYIRIQPKFILKKLTELMLKYKTKVVFAGKQPKEFVDSLFRRICLTCQS